MADQLEFTGERFTPECVREIRYEHLHRYAVAAELVDGRSVLDAACGEGYGSSLLAARARSVTGVDISEQAIHHASSRYRSANLRFEVADCCELPFPDARFEAVVSFETLEHLESQERLVREFRRVLAPGGFLVISSPDRAIYTDRQQNRNPFHVRELYRGELERLLATQFPAVRLLGQRLAFHSLIWPLAAEGRAAGEGADESSSTGLMVHRESGDSVQRQSGLPGEAVYFIALCAEREQDLPHLGAELCLFDDDGETVYRHYHHEIRKNMQAGAILEQRQREIEALKAAAGQRPSQVLASGRRRSWWRRWLGGA